MITALYRHKLKQVVVSAIFSFNCILAQQPDLSSPHTPTSDQLLNWIEEENHVALDRVLIWPRNSDLEMLSLLDSLHQNWAAEDSNDLMVLNAYRCWMALEHPSRHSEIDSTIHTFREFAISTKKPFWRQRLGYLILKKLLIQGNYTQPLNELREYGQRGRNIHDTTLQIEASIDLGHVALELNNPASSMQYFRLAQQLAVQSKNCAYEVRCLQAIALAKGLLNEADSVRFYFERAWNLHENCPSSGLRATADMLVEVGKYQIQLGWLNQSETSLLRASESYELLGQNEEQAEISLLLAQSAWQGKNYSVSEKRALQALEEAASYGQQRVQMHALELLYQIELQRKQYKSAFDYFSQYELLKDSLSDRQANEALARLEMQLNFQQQQLTDSLHFANLAFQQELQQEIRLQKEKRRRYRLLFLGLSILILAISLWLRLRQSRKAQAEITAEKQRSDNLLLNILPEEIAEELKDRGAVQARMIPRVHILFTDFVNFTKTSEAMKPEELVAEIDICFREFDRIMDERGLEKIKTIGDAYMAASGIKEDMEGSRNEAEQLALASLEMLSFMKKRMDKRNSAGLPAFSMRAGIHSGRVVAGVVGYKKFQFDLWGDAVNTASRCESHSEPGKLNVSAETASLLRKSKELKITQRPLHTVKGKGLMQMYFVSLA